MKIIGCEDEDACDVTFNLLVVVLKDVTKVTELTQRLFSCYA